jgi:hypothetical protein
MKKQALLVSFVLLVCAGTSNGSERSLGTPAERLIGHWSTRVGDHLYYAKIRADGLGSYVLVQPDGNTARHQYKIVSQIPTGERVIVQLLFSDGDKRNETYLIAKDGQELTATTVFHAMTITSQLKYVDSKIKP